MRRGGVSLRDGSGQCFPAIFPDSIPITLTRTKSGFGPYFVNGYCSAREGDAVGSKAGAARMTVAIPRGEWGGAGWRKEVQRREDIRLLWKPLKILIRSKTTEWLDAMEAVLSAEGVDRAHFLLENFPIVKAREGGAFLPYNAEYSLRQYDSRRAEARSPGNREIERKIRSIIRWNAVATILRANKDRPSSAAISPASSPATLYDVGFGHSGGPVQKHPGILSIYKVTRRPAFTRALFSKAA